MCPPFFQEAVSPSLKSTCLTCSSLSQTGLRSDKKKKSTAFFMEGTRDKMPTSGPCLDVEDGGRQARTCPGWMWAGGGSCLHSSASWCGIKHSHWASLIITISFPVQFVVHTMGLSVGLWSVLEATWMLVQIKQTVPHVPIHCRESQWGQWGLEK